MERADVEEIQAHLRKARRKLSAARRLQADGEHDDCVSRAYYAMYHAARALLLLEGIRPKTHEGLVGLIGEHFVRTGELPRDLGRALRRDRDERENGDYDAFVEFDSQESAGVLRDAEEFVAAAEGVIGRRLSAPRS